MYSFEKVTKQLGDYFPSTTSSPTAKAIAHFFTGSIAASVAVVSSQPMDVLRTRFVGQGEPKVCSVLHFFSSVERQILEIKRTLFSRAFLV
jgi:hypothetical protein